MQPDSVDCLEGFVVDKQEFACRACESVHSKQPKIWWAQPCACKMSHLICMQPSVNFTCCLQGENVCTFSKFKSSEFAVFLRMCVYWVSGQKYKDLQFLCLEMAVLISLSVTGGMYLFFKPGSLLCIKFLCTAGSNSQLVSNPCGDILVCLCENSLYFSKAEEAEVEN